MAKKNSKILRRREHAYDLIREKEAMERRNKRLESKQNKRKMEEEQEKLQQKMEVDEVTVEGNRRGGKKMRKSSDE
ncbi:hypothetical protein PPL_01727 [Heterostelium album PN500]|uniref:Uncharacterized protein n=1 Tax=Heterostelium pallidum (strain ATCC 26659 / Pp 5 / PN500) TaxID=670386 RepID=D3B0B1_HETP5|nr:hypothetical protein PPL_01727 [Heterostelium album PN500]EFA84735.1 hypothetical protein PPL_01727 [Heterostelium album PN500]|eukprot:XP_020436847.1 hypothetical protein PPL_01727 [Heterostelium album PN500]